MNLTLGPEVLDEIVKHARSCLPNESCGLIAGLSDSANRVRTRFIPMTNMLASGAAYEMDPAELILALRTMRENGEELAAIYHSHPQGPEEPSRRDIELAYYPEAAHLIVSFAAGRTATRAFRIVDGQALEVELRVIL